VKPTPVRVTVSFGFKIEKLSTVDPPGTILFGEKLLLIAGGLTITKGFESALA
jgi:hypothetical protein